MDQLQNFQMEDVSMREAGAFRSAAIVIAACSLMFCASSQAQAMHSADTSRDGQISLTELLRAIQIFNSVGYRCAAGTEDGFATGIGERDCRFHDTDYAPSDWTFSLGELLRLIQIYNSQGYFREANAEDGFGLGAPSIVRPDETLQQFDTLSQDGDDYLSPEEAAQEFDSQEAFDAADANRDGLISRFEFLQWGGRRGAVAETSNTDAPSIALIGPAEIALGCGETFVDPGATAFDPDEGDISRFVLISKRDFSERVPGSYEIVYRVSDLACNTVEVRRTILVDDFAPPQIILNGPLPRVVNCGKSYQDSQVVTTDDCLGKVTLTRDTSAVDMKTPGAYEALYTAVDTLGKKTELSVPVLVVDTLAPTVRLGGKSFELVQQFGVWNDPGATASDGCDTAPSVTVTGVVDVNEVGIYDLTYRAVDAAGNESEPVVRRVMVHDVAEGPKRLRISLDTYYDGEFTFTPAPIAATEDHDYFFPQGTSVTISFSCGDYWPWPYLYIEPASDSWQWRYLSCDDSGTILMDEDRHAWLYRDDYEDEGEGEGEGSWSGEGEGEGEGEIEGEGGYENPFYLASQFPRSNFSIDVDTASYALMRRYIDHSQSLPHGTEVRIEEYLNYFDYAYPRPRNDAPFEIYNDLIACPWAPQHHLLRIGLQAPEFGGVSRPAANIVMLIDISGSMGPKDRLPLLKDAMVKVVEQTLGPEDRVAIVTYASGIATKLPSTPCTPQGKSAIIQAINALKASGATNGSGGLQMAYAIAKENLIPGQVNRVLLGSDGDFNVGITNVTQLTQLVQAELSSGVSLTTLGFGIGNLRDTLMEALAANGNGNYHYIDTLDEAVKVLVQEARSTFQVIARDVKIRVEFDPAVVHKYRLIGYENRGLTDQEFEDDAVDAGELGLGDSVTALYEIIPQPNKALTQDVMAIVDVRYKPVDCERSRLITSTVTNQVMQPAPSDSRFAAGVAAYGMLLRNSKYLGASTYTLARALVEEGLAYDPFGHREELLNLIAKAAIIAAP